MLDSGKMTQEENRELALLRLHVQTFHQVNKFVASIYDSEKFLDLIMREAEAAVGAEASCIAIFKPSDRRLHIEFASGGADVGCWRSAKVFWAKPLLPTKRCV